MYYKYIQPLIAFYIIPFAIADESLTKGLAEYQKTVDKEEWKDLYTTQSKTPILLKVKSKEAQQILKPFKPIFEDQTAEGSKLIGMVTAYKNWALFSGYTASKDGSQITPKGGVSSDTTILLLKTRSGWTVVDYGLGHSDMFYIIWPAQYGAPVELLTIKPKEQNKSQ